MAFRYDPMRTYAAAPRLFVARISCPGLSIPRRCCQSTACHSDPFLSHPVHSFTVHFAPLLPLQSPPLLSAVFLCCRSLAPRRHPMLCDPIRCCLSTPYLFAPYPRSPLHPYAAQSIAANPLDCTAFLCRPLLPLLCHPFQTSGFHCSILLPRPCKPKVSIP